MRRRCTQAVASHDALVAADEAPVFLGPSVIDGEARAAGETIVLENILTVYLRDRADRPRNVHVVEVRPNPWAR